MKKIRIAQVGTAHDHAKATMESLLRQPDIFDVAGYCIPNPGFDHVITKRELAEKYLHGHRSAGANTWIFTELSTAEPDDFIFTVLNTTHKISDVWIELFFEDRERNIRYIKTQIRGLFTKRINIVGDDVDGDALYFNWMSLKEKGIPENTYFSVRFLCETPIVVSHKNHKATYFA